MCETYGLAKQGGARFAYSGVRGYHPLVASLADTGELLHSRLRGGNAASGKGAASFVAETISRVRHAGARGRLTLRADNDDQRFTGKGIAIGCVCAVRERQVREKMQAL